MSEKGVLSKSIANNISEAIIDKLGGTGYVPTEWSENINLLGISSADIEEALASITEDTSSSDKGLLSLSIAYDMGAMLNKKYNTSRGFKPSEVSSAVSALIPLPEKTASGSIVTFSDGADDVPTKSLVVTIAPTLSGVSSVSETQTGKNLADLSNFVDGYVNSNGTFNTNHSNGEMRSGFIPVKPDTTYYFSIVETTGTAEAWVGIGEYTDTNTSSFVRRDGYWRFTTSATTKYVVVSARNLAKATKIQLEIGNDPTNWEAYTPIKQYTASLGRTIYGGTADIVKGEGKDSYDKGSMSSAYLSGLSSYIGYETSTYYFGGHPSVWVRNWNYSRAKTKQAGGIGCVCNKFPVSMHNTDIFASQYRIYFDVNGKNISSVADFIAFVQNLEANNESLDIVYELNDTYITDFTFTGQKINTRLGNNTMWSEQGDTEVVYRADIDLYEAPSTLSDTNNTETEGNEEQEVNE